MRTMKKSKRIPGWSVLTGVFIISCSIATNAQAGWKFIYENDSSGKAAHKSIDKLITAIQAGTDVKIVVMDSAQGGGISTKCDNVIWKTNYVACVDTSQISIKPVSGGATGFHDNPYNVYTLFDTKGRIERSRWLIGDHVSKGHNVQKSAIKWFVEAN